MIRHYGLLGVGLGGFQAAFSGLMLPAPPSSRHHFELAPHAHNIILQIWAERGIPGIIALVLLAKIVAQRLLVVVLPRHRASPVALAAAAAIVALSVQMVVDYTLWYTPVLLTVWFLLGLMFSRNAVHSFDDTARSTSST